LAHLTQSKAIWTDYAQELALVFGHEPGKGQIALA
jgi:hypothetical protein